MTRDQVLAELRQHTCVMLRPSPVAGIGVFAIRVIPRGYREMFGAPRAGLRADDAERRVNERGCVLRSDRRYPVRRRTVRGLRTLVDDEVAGFAGAKDSCEPTTFEVLLHQRGEDRLFIQHGTHRCEVSGMRVGNPRRDEGQRWRHMTHPAVLPRDELGVSTPPNYISRVGAPS